MASTARPRSEEFVPLWLSLSVLVIVLIGIFFRFYNLGHKVFWEDEVLGAIHTFGYTESEIVSEAPYLKKASDVKRFLEPNEALGAMATVDSLAAEDPQHAPAYYVISHFWTQRFGGSIEALRMPAAMFGVLVLPCVFWLTLELFGTRSTALIAVALVAVSPFFVLYSQEAREYTMWIAAIAIDGALFLRALRSSTLALWLWFAAGVALSLYIYPLTALVVLGLAAYLVVLDGGKLTGRMRRFAMSVLVALMTFSPWIKAMLTSSGVERGMAAIFSSKLTMLAIARIFARDVRVIFFDAGSVSVGPVGHTVLDAAVTVLVLGLCASAIASLIRFEPYRVWGFVVIALCGSMTPLLLRDLFFHGNFVYQARYFLPLLLGVQLAVAALLSRLMAVTSDRPMRATMCAILLAVLLSGEVISCVVSSQAVTWWNKDGERAPAVAALVNQSQRPVVVGDYSSPSILELSLYLKPGIPMQLNLTCAQCNLPGRSAAKTSIRGYRTVFTVSAPNSAAVRRDHWIDPMPFPARPEPLNMFNFVART